MIHQEETLKNNKYIDKTPSIASLFKIHVYKQLKSVSENLK